MKRFSLLILLAAISTRIHAQQIPNGDFENWSSTDRAQSWLTTDDILESFSGVPVVTNTTSNTTDKYTGSFAARLETKSLSGYGAVQGSLVLGTKLTQSQDNPGGLPYTGRPAALQLRYKLSGPNVAADSAFIGVTLTRRVNGQTRPVAAGWLLLLQGATTYTLANVPLQYLSSATPDSIHIIISSGTATHLTVGTALTIDNIVMTSTALATRPEATAAAHLAVFPNPSADGVFTLSAPDEPALLQASLTVHDLTGRVVLSEAATAAGAASRILNLRGQPAGIYTVRLATPQGTLTRRITIQ